jgi:hypothetical protein
MAMITSLKPDKDLWPTDIIIKDLSSAGLPAASIVMPLPFYLKKKLNSIVQPRNIIT